MPLAENIKQIPRMQANATEYNQTDDGEYTEDFAIGIVGKTERYIDMPLAENIKQIPRMQANAIEYNQTDDGEYTELDIQEAPHNVKTVHNRHINTVVQQGTTKPDKRQAVHNVKTVHNTQINTVVQRGTTKSSTFSKTRLLVVLSVIAIIAVISVIVLAALYAKGTDDKQNTPTLVGPSPTPDNKDLIKLDISSSHKDVFASSNRTMMSRTFFDGSIAGPGKRPLMNYKGMLADRSILKGEQLDIRFKVEYKIIKKPTSNLLIFDFAMCSLCDIDKHWYAGADDINCWNMHVSGHNKTNSFKLYFQDNGKYSSSEYFVSSANVGTSKIVSYDIHVSGRTNVISYNDLSAKHFNTFNNVNFSQPPYILFGLYNPAYFQSVLQIL